jgi:hypothetical protein
MGAPASLGFSMLLAITGIAPAAAQSVSALGGKPVDIHAETMAGLAQVLAPYMTGPPAGSSPAVARALDALRKEGLLRPPQAQPRNDLAQRLGTALQLGMRTRQFLPELAKVNDALTFGTDRSARDAIVALWQKAGRAAPTGPALDKLVADARAAKGAVSTASQHVTITRPAYTIRIDHSAPAGHTAVEVVADGAGGKPERVVFSGEQMTQPSAAGDGLDQGIKPAPPRDITISDAAKQCGKLAGSWTDQEGLEWNVAGDGGNLVFTQTLAGGHRIAYQSQSALCAVDGTHIVNDIEDIGHDLPDDVRASLASDFHPPFAIRLEYRPDEGSLSGVWISGTVTYSAMWHTISVVDDPSWDKPLILTQAIYGVASGAGDKEAP